MPRPRPTLVIKLSLPVETLAKFAKTNHTLPFCGAVTRNRRKQFNIDQQMGDAVGTDPPDSTTGIDYGDSASDSDSDSDERAKDISHLGNLIENKHARIANSSNAPRSTGLSNHSLETKKRPGEGNEDRQRSQKRRTLSVSAMRRKFAERYRDDEKMLDQIDTLKEQNASLGADNEELTSRIADLEARNEYLESQLSTRKKQWELMAKLQEDLNQLDKSSEVGKRESSTLG